MNDLPDGKGLNARGAEWTAREIAQQPLVWREVAALVARERARLDAFLQPLLADPRLRVVLTGAGTSSFIGGCLAPALTTRLARRVDAVPTTDVVAAPWPCLPQDLPTLLVSFARSGGSPESVAAFEIAERALANVHHLVITCNAAGELARRAGAARNARVLVLPEATNDRGFAMTSSFTSMVLAAGLLFGALDAESVPRLAQACIELLPRAQIQAMALAARRFERAVFLGSKELQALAREAALKTLELTDGRTVAVAESVLGFRHGPKTVINERTVVVVFVSNDPYTRAYDRDLIAELRRDARAGAVLMVGAVPADLGAGDALELALPDASDLELVLLDAVFAQVLALRCSVELGLTPDSPNASGVVHRVVQGVTIHPWPQGKPHVPRG